MLSKKLAALAAISMVVAPSAAIAHTAPARAPAVSRVSADGQLTKELTGTLILATIALGLIIWGIIKLSGDDRPSSP